MIEGKICTKCKKWLVISCFGICRRSRSGLKHRCKSCLSEDSKSEKVRVAKRKYQKKYRIKNKKQIRCRALLRKVLRHKIIKPPKFVLASGRPWHNVWEFHHHDYSKPYTGYWLPKSLHRRVHVQGLKPPRKYYRDHSVQVKKGLERAFWTI